MKRSLIFLALLWVTPFAFAQESPDTWVLARQFTLHSQVLKEDRPYWVYLPPYYETARAAGRKYPVVYLLDGRAHFKALVGVLDHLSSTSSGVERIPEMIVVAVPNTKRSRDFTPTHMASGPYSEESGGADAFLRFMKDELMPEIESRYRAQPERTLIGHSLGGLLALHAFIEQPELFRNYIALDPSLWWDDAVLVKELRQQPATKITAPVNVFIAGANWPEGSDAVAMRNQRNAMKQFRSVLEPRKSASLRVKYQYFEDEIHLSVPLIAMYRGLLFDYDGYKK